MIPLLPFIPMIVKAIAGIKETKYGIVQAAPKIADALGASLKARDNKKALSTLALTGVALLASYGIEVSNEWVEFAKATAPVVFAVWTALFAVSKAQK